LERAPLLRLEDFRLEISDRGDSRHLPCLAPGLLNETKREEAGPDPTQIETLLEAAASVLPSFGGRAQRGRGREQVMIHVTRIRVRGLEHVERLLVFDVPVVEPRKDDVQRAKLAAVRMRVPVVGIIVAPRTRPDGPDATAGEVEAGPRVITSVRP